jgi:putative membrane protein
MLATVLITVVALIHLYILVLEMFLWNTKTGHKAFNLRPDFARDTRVLAANQGLYNGFLAAGLLEPLARRKRDSGGNLLSDLRADRRAFGAATASRKILYVQAIPALAALLALLI